MSYNQEGKAWTKLLLPSEEYNFKTKQKTTTWVNVMIFGQRAEFVYQHVRKGSVVFVQGPLTVRQYTTKDGRNGVSVDMIAERIEPISDFGNNNVEVLVDTEDDFTKPF